MFARRLNQIVRIGATFPVIIFVSCSKSPKLTNIPPQNNRICCFGDSLVYGVGASTLDESYPRVLEEIIGTSVDSWGTPGDTTEQALAKCESFKDEKFGVVVVTIGGNDIIKRVRWEKTQHNLKGIFKKIQETGAVVVFTGVTGPLNPTRNKHYKKICKGEGVLFIPEILDGILSDPALKADEVHPNSDGYRIMAQRVADAIRNAGLLANLK